MPYYASPIDSARLFYRDYTPEGSAFRQCRSDVSKLTLVFLHGWPMSSKMFEHLLIPLCESYRFRCIAPDRRGFGNSEWRGASGQLPVTWDTFTSDLSHLLRHLEVKNFIFIGASMGCTESLLAFQSDENLRQTCKGFVWIAPIMPFPLQSPEHPLSPSREIWDSILDGLRANRPKFVSESLPGIFALQAGNTLDPKVLEDFERIISQADGLALEKTVSIFSQSSENEIKKFVSEDKGEARVLILHGDSDQGMPKEASSEILKAMIPGVQMKIYERAGHGLYTTHARQLLDDLLQFFDSD